MARLTINWNGSWLLCLCLVTLAEGEWRNPVKVLPLKSDVQSVVAIKNDVFVAATNQLIRVNADLFKVVDTFRTGPENEHPDCEPEPADCNQPRSKVDNKNLIFTQVADKPIILSCGSVYHGWCDLYGVTDNNLTRVASNRTNPLNSLGSNQGSVVFFFRDRFYTAIGHDASSAKYHPYIVSIRKLGKGIFPLYTNSSGIAISDRYRSSYRFSFIDGFTHGDYVYLIGVEDVAKGGKETRIVRFCANDTSLQTYTQMALRCSRRGAQYDVAIASRFMSNSNVPVVFVSFRQDAKRRSSREATPLSVVCRFFMNDISEKMTQAATDCNSGLPTARLVNFYLPGGSNVCQKDSLATVCQPTLNRFIEGVNSFDGAKCFDSYDSYINAIVDVPSVNKNRFQLAWFVDSNSSLHKIKFDDTECAPLVKLKTLQPINFERSFSISGEKSFFVGSRSLVSLDMRSCGVYNTCKECLMVADPEGCGWCGSEKMCSRQNECNVTNTWSEKQCPIIINRVYPLEGPIKGNTLITIDGDYLGTPDKGRRISDAVVRIGGTECLRKFWNFTMIQCTVPEHKYPGAVNITVKVNDYFVETDIKTYDIVDSVTFSEKYTYLEMSVYGLAPSFGPFYGGTNVTVYGQGIGTGLVTEVKLGEHDCIVFKRERNMLLCSSQPVEGRSDDLTGDLSVYVDGNPIPLDESSKAAGYSRSFTYLQNPSVEKVDRLKGFYKGGTIYVYGRLFANVHEPYIAVLVESTDRSRHQTLIGSCIGTIVPMECTVPPLTAADKVATPEELENAIMPFIARITVHLDGRAWNRGSDGQEFVYFYYQNPQFNNVSDTVLFDDGRIEITGRNFQGIVPEDIEVEIGAAENACQRVDVQSTLIHCELLPEFVVANEQYEVNVKYRKNSVLSDFVSISLGSGTSNALAVALGVAIPLLLLAIILMVLYLRSRRRVKRHPAHFVEYDKRDRAELLAIDAEKMELLKAENILLDRNDIRNGPVIGKGHFGIVYRGVFQPVDRTQPEVMVAVKTITRNVLNSEFDANAFLDEALLMKDFNHPNVLPLIGVCFSEDSRPMVVTPYMDNGDLLTFLRDEENIIRLRDLIMFGVDIAQGMDYLAKLKFIHRDLAARNCMIESNMNVRVADFGLSRDVYETDSYYSSDNRAKLPVKWMAPESLEKQSFSHKSDVWSYGVVMWEIMTRGIDPYPTVDNFSLLVHLKQGHRMPQPDHCPTAIYELMRQCWDLDPGKRPEFEEIARFVRSFIEVEDQSRYLTPIGMNIHYVNYDTMHHRVNQENAPLHEPQIV